LGTEVLGKEILALAAGLGGSGAAVRWDELTWPEARDAAAALNAVIVPVGAIEQHGPHLPLAVDTLIGEAVALGVSALTGVPVVPALCYGVFRISWRFCGHDRVAPGNHDQRCRGRD